MLKNELLSVAINFLFPELEPNSKAWEKIKKYIRKEYKLIGTSVLYCLDEKFMKLLSSLSLSINKREIIVTEQSVLATEDYHIPPSLIFHI